MVDDPLRARIERELVVERAGWAGERAARVTERLQQEVDPAARFETLVVWTDVHTAFTAPGRTIYLSRRLLEQLPDDDAAAFVIAHELSHHRLGHVPAPIAGWHRLPVTLVLLSLQWLIAGQEQEHDADLLAIEICLDAGFDADRCLAAIDILTRVALDYGDLDAALGADPDARGAAPGRRSHPTLPARRAAARAHLARVRAGARLDVALAARRRRQQRRQRALLAAGGAAAALLLVALRRR
jgi:predicted Zn-dependent protease